MSIGMSGNAFVLDDRGCRVECIACIRYEEVSNDKDDAFFLFKRVFIFYFHIL